MGNFTVSQTWWDDGSGWYCDGYRYTWQQEPVQSAEQCGSHDKGIISPLLHELPCETAGSFVFEHRLAVDCKDPGLASDDMSCGLAIVCDSCTHEPRYCGLKLGHEVGLGDSSNLDMCVDDALSRDLCASVPSKVVLVRAHDWFDGHSEVSVEQQVEPYFEFLRPLLSQVADNTDASWWLLDSGASTSVWAESHLLAFRSVLQDGERLGGYKAANGSSVNMSGTAEIGVQMHMSGP